MTHTQQLLSGLSELINRLKARLKNGLNGGSEEERLLRERGQLAPVPVRNNREPFNRG